MNDSMRFKMVPVEPTDEMIVAFAEAWYSKRQALDDPDMLDAYRDMLAVAPEPTAAETLDDTKRLLSAITAGPAYDEAKELAACRAEWEKRILAGPFGNAPFPDFWIGWLACAQSRAKAGEVGS